MFSSGSVFDFDSTSQQLQAPWRPRSEQKEGSSDIPEVRVQCNFYQQFFERDSEVRRDQLNPVSLQRQHRNALQTGIAASSN